VSRSFVVLANMCCATPSPHNRRVARRRPVRTTSVSLAINRSRGVNWTPPPPSSPPQPFRLQVMDKPALVKWAVKTSLASVVAQGKAAASDGGGTAGGGLSVAQLEAICARAADAPDGEKVAAGDFGTRAHAAIDRIIRGDGAGDAAGAAGDGGDIAAVVAGFQRWYATSGLRLSPLGDVM
jgi:hypothetical protein